MAIVNIEQTSVVWTIVANSGSRRESKSMKRLTYTDEELSEFSNMECPVKANDLVNNFCDNVCDEFQHNCPFMKMAQKLKYYEDKQEQGLLIELKAKVGDDIFKIINGSISRLKITRIEITIYGIEYFVWGYTLTNEGYGVTWFLTNSEAEEALAKMGGK